MLRGLRKASSNWLGKVVMAGVVGFLVISFAIWGIADIFRGFGRSTVAKIAGTEITIEQFRVQYNDRLQQFARQLGRPLSTDQARALGLDQLVIKQIISDIALDERARVLGLNLSDAAVAKVITGDPTFQGPTGQFDRTTFEQTIRNAGYTEPRFIAEQRRRLIRRQLAGTFVTGLSAPKALMDAINRFQNEQRSIDYVLLDSAQAGEIPQPTAEELQKYFEERKVLFRAPEYRKLVVVSLLPSDEAKWIEIPEADVKRAYEEHRDRFTTPERRHIEQIDFPDADAANAAAERIAKGASFVDIAKELGKSESDIDLGTVTKASMIDRAVADAAFALKEGEVSAPVKGRFGTVLIKVVKIEPENVRPYEEVAGAIKQELALARAKDLVSDVYNKIEDARLEGKPLTEITAEVKIPVRTVDAVDRTGHDPGGVAVNLPNEQPLLAAAFSTDVGGDHDALQFQDGYIWFDVAGITPSRERPLDEVKDQVEARWREQEIAARLETKANELIDKLKGGATLADVAAANKLKVESLSGIKRGEGTGSLSAAAVDVVFRTAKDAVGKGAAAQSGEQVVFRVTDITVPTLDPKSAEAKRMLDTLNRGLSEDIFAQYATQVEAQLGVTINQSAVNQVTGGGSGDNEP